MKIDEKTIKQIYLPKVYLEWINTDSNYPIFLPKISDSQKAKNKKEISIMIEQLNQQLSSYPGKKKRHFMLKFLRILNTTFMLDVARKNKQCSIWRKDTLHMISHLLKTEEICGIHHYLSDEELDCLLQELILFLQRERSFAPNLPLDEIGQAIRNYIVYIMFRLLSSDETTASAMKETFSSACFGYSMLYPFTDNYTDSSTVTKEDKKIYNQMIHDKIKGNTVYPTIKYHKKTCELLQMIENEYDRSKSPGIYILLLMILEAQERSMHLQTQASSSQEKTRLQTSIFKGGISVLIDRIFVNEEISEQDLIFYLNFGFFLQLADDLQDIKEDHMSGNQTIFTSKTTFGAYESVVNQIFHYVHKIINQYAAPRESMKYFIEQSCYLLILASVYQSKEYFSKEYLTSLEQCFLIDFDYLEQLSNIDRISAQNTSSSNLMTILDELLLV